MKAVEGRLDRFVARLVEPKANPIKLLIKSLKFPMTNLVGTVVVGIVVAVAVAVADEMSLG